MSGSTSSALPVQRLVGGAGFDGQLVERQMVGGQRQRLAVKFRPPRLPASGRGGRRSGRTRARGKLAPGHLQRQRSPGRRNAGVRAGRRSAVVADDCTPSDSAVHAGVAAKAARRPASTLVGLASSVISSSGSGAEQAARIGDQQSGRRCRGPSGWGCRRRRRSTPSGRRPEPRGLPCQFPAQRMALKRAWSIRGADMAVEVAVRAFVQTERPVDVERQRLVLLGGRGHVGRQRASSVANARARWLPPPFVVRSTSP